MSERSKLVAKQYTPDPHRLLPQSSDAEKGVLCSILISPRDVCGLCIEKGITPEHFHIPSHCTIYRELLAAWERNEPIDFIMLTQVLRDKGVLDQCGGAAYATDLFTFLPTAANAPYYIDILHDKYILRKTIEVCTEGAGRGYEEQEDPMGLLDQVEQKVMAIRGKRHSSKQTVKQTVIEVMGDLEHAYSNPGTIGGMTTGFPDVDDLWDGMKPEEMIVIAALPGCGKTCLAMNVMEHVTITLGLAGAIFSLEMSQKQLIQRSLCSRARVNYYRWRDGFSSERDFPALTKAAVDLSNAKITIDDEGQQTIQEMRAKARRLKAEQDIRLVLIDYLQIARSNTKRAQDNRTQEVAEISGGIKAMAKELGIPVIVLAQVDRSVDKSKRRPRISDLRESAAIAADADKVGLLYRESMYAEDEEERYALKGKATLITAKHRNGAIGDIPLTFLEEFGKFETRARGVDEPGLGI